MRLGGHGIFAGKSVLGINLEPSMPLGSSHTDVEITTDAEYGIPVPDRARTGQVSMPGGGTMGRNALIFGGLALAALGAWYFWWR